jgi:hypothetical protein
MSILTPIPPHIPLAARLFYAIPLIGWIARDVVFGDKDNIWYALAILATVWILSIITWGYAAIIIPYLMMVPVCFFFIIVMSRP